MSQDIWSVIDPDITTGTMLAATLTDFKDALMSGCAGTSRPSTIEAGGLWIDTTNQGTPNFFWSLKIYTGAGDIEIFRLSVLNGIGGSLFGDSEFDIKKISADTVGPILFLIKNRLASNGQVLDGDVVGEMRFVGATNTSTAPTTAYVRFTASDDESDSVYGGTLSFASTADATNTITEHLRFIAAVVETVKPLKVNSLRLVPQNIATAATIAALDASTILAEMTGSTATAIQGINATQATQFIHIHNRSSATVTLKHENTSATSTNRMKLPNAADLALISDSTAVLYYCSTDARWKIISVSEPKPTRTVVGPFINLLNTWTAPAGKTRIRITGKYRGKQVSYSANGNVGFLTDAYGNMYAWGNNTASNPMPIGDTVARSSPVAILGALTVKPRTTPNGSTLGATPEFLLTTSGQAFAWGSNGFTGAGCLGTGSAVAALVVSSPVAVLGGLKFSSVYASAQVGAGLTPNNKLYIWGLNNGDGNNGSKSSPVAVLGALRFATYLPGTSIGLDTTGKAWGWDNRNFLNGVLGNGDNVAHSSPIAVLGAHTFTKIVDDIGFGSACGLDTAGQAWCWGDNSNGQLGDGTLVSKSSPVAVIGGLVFTNIYATGSGSYFGQTADGTLYAWGYGGGVDSPYLGIGLNGVGFIQVTNSSPVAVFGSLKFTQVIVGSTSFAKATDGNWYSWGNNGNRSNGSLGQGLNADNIPGTGIAGSSPGLVLGGINFEYIVNRGSSNWGVTSDGTMYGWGENGQVTFPVSGGKGSLAQGNLIDQSSPVACVGAAMPGPLPTFGPVAIDVVPGTSYPILLTQGACYFGDRELDLDLESITIEYN